MNAQSARFEFLNSVIDMVNVCSVELLRIYNSEIVEATYKSDDSPVTRADRWADNFITQSLNTITPQIPVISEEGEELNYAKRKKFNQFWLVDPLDGTKEFIARTNEFTVNVALMENNRPVLGVVAVPYYNLLYYAVKGEGAYKIDQNKIVKIHCSEFRMQQKNLRVPISRSHLNAETQMLLISLNEPILQPVGSALKFMYIAEGRSDYYPRIGITMEWDTAAAEIILTESGATLVQLDTLKPLLYNKPDLRNPNFLAHGKRVEN